MYLLYVVALFGSLAVFLMLANPAAEVVADRSTARALQMAAYHQAAVTYIVQSASLYRGTIPKAAVMTVLTPTAGDWQFLGDVAIESAADGQRFVVTWLAAPPGESGRVAAELLRQLDRPYNVGQYDAATGSVRVPSRSTPTLLPTAVQLAIPEGAPVVFTQY